MTNNMNEGLRIFVEAVACKYHIHSTACSNARKQTLSIQSKHHNMQTVQGPVSYNKFTK